LIRKRRKKVPEFERTIRRSATRAHRRYVGCRTGSRSVDEGPSCGPACPDGQKTIPGVLHIGFLDAAGGDAVFFQRNSESFWSANRRRAGRGRKFPNFQIIGQPCGRSSLCHRRNPDCPASIGPAQGAIVSGASTLWGQIPLRTAMPRSSQNIRSATKTYRIRKKPRNLSKGNRSFRSTRTRHWQTKERC